MVKNGMRPIHPGEILREEFLKPLNMSAHALSKALLLTPARINDVVRERRSVTPDTALRLAKFFGGDAQSWLNLQQEYDLKMVAREADLKRALKAIEPLADSSHFALAA